MFIKSFQTFGHKKSGGWILLQDQAKLTNTHAYWKGDFTETHGGPAIVRAPGPPVVDRVQNPRGGDIKHGWHSARMNYAANSIRLGVYLLPGPDRRGECLRPDGGRDRTGGAIRAPFPNNRGSGACSWVKLYPDRWVELYATEMDLAKFNADPPPGVTAGSTPPVEPPVDPPPQPAPSGVTIEINGVAMKPGETVTIKMAAAEPKSGAYAARELATKTRRRTRPRRRGIMARRGRNQKPHKN